MANERAHGTDTAPVFDSELCAAQGRVWLLVAAILASALGFIDGSVVAIALPAIRDNLQATLGQAQWIANAYLLCLSAFILVGGALGDRFGLPRVFGAGIVVFVLASLLCAVAPTAEVLILARAVQGIGAAAMVPGSLALVSRAYPRAERGRAIGIWASASALTTALGPVVGGGVLSLGGPDAWRWIFAVNLPLGALALWLLWRHASTGRRDTARALDLPGAALAVSSLGLLAWGLGGENGTPYWLLALGGAALFAVFLGVESRVAAPMVPLELFANRVFATANLLSFFVYFALTAMLFYLPMTLIAVWGVSELAASAAFVPLTLFVFALSAPMGRLADQIGPRAPIAAGAAVVALGYGLVGATAPWQAYWSATLPAMALAGAGMALMVAPLSAAVMSAVGDDRQGTASGINNAVTRVAGLIAVAAMGSLAAMAYATAGGPLGFAADGGGADHARATTRAFQVVAYVCAALSALGSLITWVGMRPDAPITSR